MTQNEFTFDVFIENEAGSMTKNTYNEETLAHLGARTVAAPYPFPYGFVRHTKSGDGDALDCFVVTQRPLSSGETVRCVAIHLLEQIEDGARDHKILAIPTSDDGAHIDGDQVDAIRRFIMRVFSDVPGKRMELGGLLNAEAARQAIADARLDGGA